MYQTVQRTPPRLHLCTHFPFRGKRIATVTVLAAAIIAWAFTQQRDVTLQLIALMLGLCLVVHQWFITRRRELIFNTQAYAVFINRHLAAQLSEVTSGVVQGCGRYNAEHDDPRKRFDSLLRRQSGAAGHLDRNSEKKRSALGWTIAGFLETRVRFQLWP